MGLHGEGWQLWRRESRLAVPRIFYSILSTEIMHRRYPIFAPDAGARCLVSLSREWNEMKKTFPRKTGK